MRCNEYDDSVIKASIYDIAEPQFVQGIRPSLHHFQPLREALCSMIGTAKGIKTRYLCYKSSGKQIKDTRDSDC